MNERIFPRRHFSKSFIPPALRSGYGMATVDHQESISAYYFYRLISRAKKVVLLYDSRTSGLSSGEPSRYIHQLRYLYRPKNIKYIKSSYNLTTLSSAPLSITLSDAQRNALRRYLDPASGCYLSASAINKFINCPVDFILSELEGYREDDEVKDYFDESTYGSVVHEVVEKLYSGLQRDGKPLLVDKEIIRILNNDSLIKRQIVRSINDLYYKLGKDVDTLLTGDADIMARLILPLVKLMLAHELDGVCRFQFISAEDKKTGTLRFPGGLALNFKYIIDRVDKVVYDDGRETLRIVDYKTGSDPTKAASLEDLFNNGLEHRPKAMLQLFLYANAYAQFNPEIAVDAPIVPQIYSFRTIGANATPEPLVVGGSPLTDYREYNDEFMSMMEDKLNQLFGKLDSDEPIVFTTSESPYSCKYCMFKTLCGKG